MKFTGRIWKFGDHINTDLIIPARYINSMDPAFLATHCMEDTDPDFVKKIKPGDIIVAGENFGCGSSRKHPHRHQGSRDRLRHRKEFRPNLLPERLQHGTADL